MRKSHVISLFILFIVVTVLILSQAFTGPGSDTTLNGPTRSPVTAPPTSTKKPTPTATVAPKPTPIVKPQIDLSKYAGLSQSATWWYTSMVRDAANPDKVTYYPDPAAAKLIEGTDCFYERSQGEGKEIYLTFKLGYFNYETEILDTLKAANVRATFFVPANYLTLNAGNKEKAATVLKRIVEEGHTFAARDVIPKTTVTPEQFCDNLWTVTELYQQYAGDTKQVEYYFPDQLTELNIALVEAMGSKVSLFSFSVGGEDASTTILNNMVKNTADGSILSLSTSKNQSAALKDYISQMQTKGYTFNAL